MDIVKGTVESSAMVPVVALRVERTGIPNNLIAAVSNVLGKRYDRNRLVTLFSEHGAPGHPPFGNRVDMCRSWLHDVNRDESMWPLTFLGKIIQSVMDGDDKFWSDDRKYIEDALAQANLSYYRGELIARPGVEMAQSRKGMPHFRDIAAVEAEFKECRKGDYTMTDQEKLQMLFDRMQIAEAIHRYPVSIDSRDWKLFRSIFTDEIQVYLGPPIDKLNLRTVSADKFTEEVTGVISRFAVTQHFLTDYHVEVNGNEAVCVSYMQARHFKEGQPTWDMGGYYTYHLVRTDDGWRISKYTLIVTWEENRPLDFRF